MNGKYAALSAETGVALTVWGKLIVLEQCSVYRLNDQPVLAFSQSGSRILKYKL